MSNTKKVNKKTETKTVAPVAANNTTTKVERVKLGDTTYHLWRHFTKSILREAGIISAKFVKDEGSYNGIVTVVKSEKDKAKKAILDYQKKEECIDLITF